MKRDLKERFEEKFKIVESGCWEWQFRKNNKGYGELILLNKKVLAHRLAYELYVDKIPNGLCVLHHCDNTSCVNPKHLFLGTYKDNMDDMYNKGRRNRAKCPSLTSYKNGCRCNGCRKLESERCRNKYQRLKITN